ncbi:hypothetical protein L9H78_09625 [Corynebacterium pseudodiphtheriticum]|uniref:alpha/beta hydrolase-fold protein n=1 Tax=Corynebacterium pseudodiphtheriticum TaxID=37637 RepID=UPI0020C04750|nr:alpha/beta hydrolase-fold protein [Corynebacterium pseudodiphtheriticum]UQV56016.1 hypothetical protein L9H27_09715 [Corynebacterium pseudodiphtheriticum]UQV58065.1 hypothetical protein L9H78_09625 [Corynebacterium pseudodiphtheriticum]
MRLDSSRSPHVQSQTAGQSRGTRGRAWFKALAVPTAVATGLAVVPISTQAPVAHAQSSLPGSSNLLPKNDGLTDSVLPGEAPQRSTIETEYPSSDGLPAGVEIDRVEYKSPRHAFVYVKSAAMPDQEMKFQILLARDYYAKPNQQFPELWLMDGLRARETESGWTIATDVEQYFADKNVNVVLPVGGESSFYSDWQQPDNGKHYKWESFLTKEVIPIMDNKFRSNKQRAVAGLSMGATSAINMAERNPHLFNFAGSFSGYLDTTSKGMPEAIQMALSDGGGYNAEAMWGPLYSQGWIDHDPKLGIEQLRDMTVYVSSGSGQPDFGDPNSVAKHGPSLPGVGLEVISRMSTQTFVDRAKAQNVDVVAKFRPTGIHTWEYWEFELKQAWPYIANSLSIPQEGRAAECEVKGAIGASVAGQAHFEECLTNEYQVGETSGVAQDFTGGTAYWSPETGAHGVYGAINARYAQLGGATSWLGFPKSTELGTPDGKGRLVQFENGNIYWHPDTGAWEVPNDLLEGWKEYDYERGRSGYPTGKDEHINGGKLQPMQGGFLARNREGKTHLVFGAIAKKYATVDKADLGLPISNEYKIDGGWFQQFENGNIYFSPESGAQVIKYGKIFDEWGKHGYEKGKFGWPTADFESKPGVNEQKFQNGTLQEINGGVREK